MGHSKHESMWADEKRSNEPQFHRRNIEADIERPLAPCGIVDGRGRVLDGTTPGPRGKMVYGKVADVRADLEVL